MIAAYFCNNKQVRKPFDRYLASFLLDFYSDPTVRKTKDIPIIGTSEGIHRYGFSWA